MPIFELDEGRPRLVQPMQPLAGSFAQECTALLAHHLAAVAGESLFVVRSRAGAPDHADLPELLALDATGRPVVFEVIQVVDEDAVVSALRHAGAAARLTTTDLARAYHVDPGRFAVDFAAFREQVASGGHRSRLEGVRLVVLCSEVAAEAGDTLSFLRGPGRNVDVLQVGVVRGVDDRRLLDLSPLATHEGVRRSVEPTALRLVRSSEAFATAMAYEPDRTQPGQARKPPTGELRAVTPSTKPNPPAPTPFVRRGTITEPTPLPFGPARDGSGALPRTPTGAPVKVPTAPLPTTTTGPPGGTGPDRRQPDRAPAPRTSPAPTTLTPIIGLRSAADQPVKPRSFGDEPVPVAGPRPFVPTSGPTDVVAAPPRGPAAPASGRPTRLPVTAPVPVVPGAQSGPPAPVVPAAQPGPDAGPAPTTLPTVAQSGVAQPDARLALLAKSRRTVTTLVWVRERRGERHLAALRPDGLLELPGGAVYADPNAAAAAAVGSEGYLDGWRAWRLGDGGPTLAEAIGLDRV